MLNWVNSMIPHLNITNFTSNWQDGRALLSLIHEIKPDKAPTVSSLDCRKSLSNCTLAIRTAKIYLKVPPIITPEDLINNELDELSLMTYLSYFVKPATKTVLRWIHEVLPQMKITNLTTDWNSGVALAGILNNLFPGLFPKWKSLSQENWQENIQKVFDIAKSKCGIESNLGAQDMADPSIEELHVMTYILRMRYANLLSLPDQIDISGLGIKEAKLGRQTHFFINTTEAGAGEISVSALYQDETAIKFSLTEKRPGILKLAYTPEKPGKLQFNIFWSGILIPGSPFNILVSDTNLVKILNRENLHTTVHVHSRIQIRLDATAIDRGSLATRLMYSDSPPLSPEVTNDNGIYTVEFVPINTGTPTLRFYWDKDELKNCAIQFTILDTRKYQLSHLPKKSQFQTFESISFLVESKEDLPLHPLKMTAICGDIHIPFQFSGIQGNRGKAVFIPTLPGSYRLEVACVDRLVDGSPFEVTIVDPSKCLLLTKPPKYLALNTEFEFLLDTKEAGPGKVKFTSLDAPNAFTSIIDSSQLAASIKVTPKILGEYMISISHCGGEIPGCPLRVTICDPSSCTVTGNILETKTTLVGQPVVLFVTNPNWGDTKPSVKVQGLTARYPVTLEEKTPEEFSAHFIPWEVGVHDIYITQGGFAIPNTPFQFTASKSSSSTCSATGSGLQEALTGIPAQFLIHASSGLLDGGNLVIQAQSVVSGAFAKVRARDNSNSSYNVAYLADTPGAYLIHIKAWNKDIPGSPFRLNVSQGPQANNCKMTGGAINPNNLIKIGDPIELSIETRRAGSGNLSVDAVGPRGAQARVFMARGGKPGLYDIQLDPIRPGKYRVSAKWSGQHIPESPFIMRVFPGADASKCKAYGPGLQDGHVGQPSVFTIETQNAGSGVLKVRLNGVKNAFKVEVKPTSPQNVRTLLANYNPTKPGDYLITIKWSERDIPGSPFKVNIGGKLLEDSNYNNGLLQATPGMVELDTIPEEYEGSESQFSLDNFPHNTQQKSTRHSKFPSSPATHNGIPIFNDRSFNYRNNLSTRSPVKPGRSAAHKHKKTYSGRANLKMSGKRSPKKSILKKT